MSDVYNKMEYLHDTRKGYLRLEKPFRYTSSGQKGLSYIGPKLWNDLSFNLKACNGSNTFKHKLKEDFFKTLKRKEDDIYIYILLT